MTAAPPHAVVPLPEDVVTTELRIPVATPAGEVHVAATVYAPREVSAVTTLACAYPGGGYGRRYYDALQRDPDVVLAHASVTELLR